MHVGVVVHTDRRASSGLTPNPRKHRGSLWQLPLVPHCLLLLRRVQVYAVDLRHHGDSSTAPDRGYHIARLAADLRDFLEALQLNDVTGES
jgi:pimeloyl-ACP methyl ester carboxylesterase